MVDYRGQGAIHFRTVRLGQRRPDPTLVLHLEAAKMIGGVLKGLLIDPPVVDLAEQDRVGICVEVRACARVAAGPALAVSDDVGFVADDRLPVGGGGLYDELTFAHRAAAGGSAPEELAISIGESQLLGIRSSLESSTGNASRPEAANLASLTGAMTRLGVARQSRLVVMRAHSPSAT